MKHRQLFILSLLIILFFIPLSIHILYWIGAQPPRLQSGETALDELNAVADSIEEWFKEFTGSIVSPLWKIEKSLSQKPLPEKQEAFFDILEQAAKDFRYEGRAGHLSLFDESGKAIAWTSGSTLIAAETLKEEPFTFSLKREGGEIRICAFKRIEPSAHIAASEFLIESKLRDYTFSDLISEKLMRLGKIQIEIFEKKHQNEEVADLFSRLGERFLSKEEKTLYLSLTAGRDDLIGFAKIAATEPQSFLQFATGEAEVLFSYLLFCLFILTLFFFIARSKKISKSERGMASMFLFITLFGAASFFLWVFRIFILRREILKLLFPDAVAGPIYFGTSEFFGLFHSPLDLFLTTSVLLVQIALVIILLHTLKAGLPSRISSGALLLGECVILLLLVLIAFIVAGSIVENSRINIMLFEYGSYGIIRLIMQASIFLPFLSASLIAIAIIRSVHRIAGLERLSVEKVSDLKLISAFSFIAAIGVFVILDHSYSHLKASTILKEFRYEIIQQEASKRQLIEESLVKIGSSSSLFPEIFATTERDDTLAFELWEQTELSTLGVMSSLEIYNREGELISRFTQDLPGFNEQIALDDRESFEPEISEEAFSVGSTRGNVLHGEIPVISGSMIAGIAVIHILDQPENIPFLTLGRSYSEFYRKSDPSLLYAELIGVEPPFIVYDKNGKIIFSSIMNPPPFSESIRRESLLNPNAWTGFHQEQFPYHLFSLPHNDKFYVTGYPAKRSFQQLSLFIKIAFFSLVLAFLIITFGKAISRPSSLALIRLKNFLASIRQSYHRKLLTAIIIASLIPLLSLSFIIRGYISTKAQEGIFNRGINTLASSRRVVSDYISIEIDEADLTDVSTVSDEVLYWLNTIVRQDINIYAEGLLQASSRRDLFLSGLLPYRLDSDAYKKIILKGEPYHIKKEHSRGFYTLYAALDVPSFKQGVISIPLNISGSNILREAKNVEDVILIITVLTLLLLTLIGYFMALSISKPVVRLVDATVRLASGDYETQIQPSTSDETRLLTESFNAMADSLKAQREDLKKRKDYIEKILNNITAGVISTNSDGTVVTINPTASSLLTPDSPLPEGMNLLRFFSEDKSFSGMKDLLERSLASQSERLESEIEISMHEHALQLRIVIIPLLEEDPAHAGRIVVIEDITEMIKSNRLSAWAEMAKNIAHEIKNPLTPIQLSAEHLKKIHRDRREELDRIFEECLTTIIKQVRELRKISEDFSAYSKLPELKREVTDPVDLVHELLAPYRASLKANIRLREEYGDVPQISVDRRVMKGALTNIVENSIQAIVGEGEISVSVLRPQQDRDAVMIIIEDNGEGVSKENLDRLFDPYFSTKEHGTGIGLAITKKVIEEHGGAIRVESEVAKGTKMIVTLPAIHSS